MATLDGKVALVTGGARGIGGETAKLLAAEGGTVVIADVRDDLAREAAAEIDGHQVRLDVSDELAWLSAIDEIRTRHGRLDVLVNSAGIFEIATLPDTDEALFMRTVRINQLGVFLGMRTAAPLMAAGGGGSIVNLSSVAGIIGSPGTIAYSASKWAVRGMTKVAANELAAQGIRVNSVHPGGIDTPMLRDMKGDRSALGERPHIPMGRPGEAIEVARMILFLASDASSYCTGSEFVCDGGLTAL